MTPVRSTKQIGPFLLEIIAPNAEITHDESATIIARVTNTSNTTATLSGQPNQPFHIRASQNDSEKAPPSFESFERIDTFSFTPGESRTDIWDWDTFLDDDQGTWELQASLRTLAINGVEIAENRNIADFQTPPLLVNVRRSNRYPQLPARIATVEFGPFRAEMLIQSLNLMRRSADGFPYLPPIITRLRNLTTETQRIKVGAFFTGVQVYVNRPGEANSVAISGIESGFASITLSPSESVVEYFGDSLSLDPGRYEFRAFLSVSKRNGQPIGNDTRLQRLSEPVLVTVA